MYKVVCNQEGKLFSCVIGNSSDGRFWEEEWKVEYVPYEWIKAKVGNIILFKNLKDTKSFSSEFQGNYIHPWEIWECQVKNAKRIEILAPSYSKDFLAFWEEALEGLMAPTGSYQASEVKLMKKMTYLDLKWGS